MIDSHHLHSRTFFTNAKASIASYSLPHISDDRPDCKYSECASKDFDNLHRIVEFNVRLDVSVVGREGAMLMKVLKKVVFLKPSLVQPSLESIRAAVWNVLDSEAAPVNVCERSSPALNI